MHRHSVMIQPDCYKLLVSADTNQMLVRSGFLSLLNSLEHHFRINTRHLFSHLAQLSFLLHQTYLSWTSYLLSSGKCELHSIIWKLGGRRGKENHCEIFQSKLHFYPSFDLIQWFATVNYRSIGMFKQTREKPRTIQHSRINVNLMYSSLKTDFGF